MFLVLKIQKKTNLTQIALDEAILILGGDKNFYKQRPSQKDLIESYESANPKDKCGRTYSTALLQPPEPIIIRYE